VEVAPNRDSVRTERKIRAHRLQSSHRRGCLRCVSLAALVAAAALSACGGGAGAPASPSPAGPIRIGVAVTVIPGAYDAKAMYDPAIKAATGYIRQHGGWGGRRVQFVECSSPGDVASDTECYRDFLAQHVMTEMGILANSFSLAPQLLYPAGIPTFNITSNASEDRQQWQNSITPGIVEVDTAVARYACAEGYKNVSWVHDDTPIDTDAWDIFAASIFHECGITLNNVPAPYGSPDPAPYVEKAVSTHPDLLFFAITVPAATMLNAISNAGYPMSKVVSGLSLNQQFFSDPRAVGITLGSGWDLPVTQSRVRDVQTYLTAMKKYAPGSNPLAQLSLPAFQSLITIWEVAKAVGFANVTGPAIERYMTTRAPGHLRIFAALTDKNTPAFPGVRVPYFHLYRWTRGRLVDLGWWPADSTCGSPPACATGIVR